MIVVIATVQVESGKRDELLKHFLELVPSVLAEEGCIEYGPVVDLETMIPAQEDPDPDKMVVLEKWDSVEALEQHLIAPHMVEYRTKVKTLIKSVDLQVLQPVTA